MDPVYGFSAVNVEAQLRNQGSFLHWLRRMLTERRALPVMGVGEMEVLPCANPSVLAYMRSGEVADIMHGGAQRRTPAPHAIDRRRARRPRLGAATGDGPHGAGRATRARATRWCAGSRPCSACTT